MTEYSDLPQDLLDLPSQFTEFREQFAGFRKRTDTRLESLELTQRAILQLILDQEKHNTAILDELKQLGNKQPA